MIDMGLVTYTILQTLISQGQPIPYTI